MDSQNIKTFTDANFEAEVLKSPTPTLVDFWATWCAPCKAIAPHVEAIATAFAGKLNVGKMDIDFSQRTPTTYEVRSIPTLLIFHQGKVIGQVVGALPKAKIEQFVAQALQKVGAPAAQS
jgi:thioredoxin 1